MAKEILGKEGRGSEESRYRDEDFRRFMGLSNGEKNVNRL